MELNELISKLRDVSNMRSASHFKRTICKMAAQRLEAQQIRIAQLEAELKEERYRHDRRWIPVEERLPEARKWVLCACRAGIIEVLKYDQATDDWDSTMPERCYMKSFVTHWRPLPEPPEEVG